MPKPTNALITGASSGIGCEAAAQLAEWEFKRIVLVGRTSKKAEAH